MLLAMKRGTLVFNGGTEQTILETLHGDNLKEFVCVYVCVTKSTLLWQWKSSALYHLTVQILTWNIYCSIQRHLDKILAHGKTNNAHHD